MKEDSIVVVTKDAMCKGYLPIYGNSYWKGKTPNIDELAQKGTVFHRYYTAAPSTVMAFRSMMFGKNPYETPYANYAPATSKSIDPITENDFFAYGKKLGFSTHLIWDRDWTTGIFRYGNCFGDTAEMHTTDGVNEPVGPHCNHPQFLCDDDEKLKKTVDLIRETISEICCQDEKVLIWLHLPHVIAGRTAYGGDIDAFDMMVGVAREFFNDKNIFISADHGNMDGYKDTFSYGFDVYTPAVEIPLITPRINNMNECYTYISNIDIKKIVFERLVPERDYILSDTAYYAQPHRKLLIIKNDFAYIYSKKGKKEEIYDLIYDNYERCNLINNYFMDNDRGLKTLTREVYFSPRWDEIDEQLAEFRRIKDIIWKEPTIIEKIYGSLFMTAKRIFVKLRKTLLGR